MTVLIQGELINIPVPSNSTAMASLQRQRKQLKTDLEAAYATTIEELKAEIEFQKGIKEDLLAGIIFDANLKT